MLLIFLFVSVIIVALNKKPNFIIILTDDLGYTDLRMNGSPKIHTTHSGKLAENGGNFTNGYVTGSVCSPSSKRRFIFSLST
ncbi:sulfatase-like hydrolase/transferase [Draconibacterium mangrovi]|uniref:sulfatase-like hydrolase/transferase n=1 Tax=Draconibacterium mangrovi TaxID=2697469 RepID=UPI0013D40499